MSTTPKKDTVDKASQFGFGLTFKSSNQADYPVAYQEDIWDVAAENTKLKELMGQIGQYDQHAINEELATMLSEMQRPIGDISTIKTAAATAKTSISGAANIGAIKDALVAFFNAISQ